MKSYTIKTEDVKSAIAGREAELFENLAGIPAESLDGKQHSCFACGGQDRFNYRNDTGRIYCRQCSPSGLDVFDVIQKRDGVDFPTSLQRVAEYIGIKADAPVSLPPVKRDAPAKPIRQTELIYRHSNGEPATAIPPLDEGYTEHLHRKFGKPDVVYSYRNIGGQLQYQILRWNATAARDKIVRPDRKGLTKDNKIPYCLDRLLSADGIAIHEGEKATDAFNRDYDAFMAYSPEYVRWVGVTAGACSYAEVFRNALSNPENRNAFWNGFTEKPKPVLIFTDNDEAGHRGAFDVRDVFRSFGFEPLIYSLPFCGGAAEDYADYFANHFTADGVGQPIEALFELSILTNEGGKF